MNKEQITEKMKDCKTDFYDNGGSRTFIDGEAGHRQLIVDTYLDKEFAKYIEKCVREYF